MSKLNYDHSKVESKWQKQWASSKTYSPDILRAEKPFFNLMMFPYPSAEGLHVGNVYAFSGADVYGRFQRMQGFDVFEPIGLDGFGIHSENYAIKVGRHPKEHAKISEENFYNQLRAIGNGFAWEHKLETCDPVYYRWTQWLFIQMFKAGLAYRGQAVVNWCPTCKTVLADEQVIDGKCERTGDIVEKREMSSWYFKITQYADKLLEGIDKIDWPSKIKNAQRNWIGRSEGRLIEFKLKDSNKLIKVFTTRADTLNAVTFIATSKLYEEGSKEKVGQFTGNYAISPLDGREIPIWDTNYVAPGYATGIVMGVPAHDERDRDFATKYAIDILDIEPKENNIGKNHVNYHLRDWLISRQRYWGPPIPMVYCEKCDWQPVPLDQLPVLLPDIDDFKPKGDGTSPLANAPSEWQHTKCPNCGGEAKRELDVSDTFLDSSWYFLAYTHMANGNWQSEANPFDPSLLKKWYPVNTYIGGAEHAVLHLLYARFVWKVLIDQDFVAKEIGDEPFPYLFSHGLIIKDGSKMSKSKGNVVVPDDYIKKFGADTLRAYLMFLGPYDKGGDFRDTGIEGMHRFLMRVWKLFESQSVSSVSSNQEVNVRMHQTIKKVTKDIKNFDFNTAISVLMEYVNIMRDKGYSKQNLIVLAQLMAPFAPHMAEEAWESLGQEFSIHSSKWPKANEKMLKQDEVNIAIQVNGKFRGTISVGVDNIKNQGRVEEEAKQVENVSKWIKDKQVKVVYVEGKIINFVVYTQWQD